MLVYQRVTDIELSELGELGGLNDGNGDFHGCFHWWKFWSVTQSWIFSWQIQGLHRKTMAAVAGADFFLALRVGHGSPVSSQMRPVSISTTSLSPATISRLIRIAWQWSAKSWQKWNRFMVGWLRALRFTWFPLKKMMLHRLPSKSIYGASRFTSLPVECCGANEPNLRNQL